ncbi:MAG: hypothetical protein GXY58_00185 [Planctomycetaceae bacterium]|nr:hypothetical protein [Planctomycetaceae bacterium]
MVTEHELPCRPSVLLVGAGDFHEFGDALRWLRAHTQLETARTVTEAVAMLAERTLPWHTIVIGQTRPGEFAEQEVERLSRAMPLAQLVGLLGSCCEGEARSGRPWPGVVRVYWHQFAARAASELRAGDTATSWQLPRTASDAERTEHALHGPRHTARGLIAISTARAVFFDALASACRVAGYTSIWSTGRPVRRAADPAALLWHGQLDAEEEFQQLRSFAALAPQTPLVALLSFPRYDQVQRARTAGAAAVLPIPFQLPDLWNTLQELTR